MPLIYPRHITKLLDDNDAEGLRHLYQRLNQKIDVLVEEASGSQFAYPYTSIFHALKINSNLLDLLIELDPEQMRFLRNTMCGRQGHPLGTTHMRLLQHESFFPDSADELKNYLYGINQHLDYQDRIKFPKNSRDLRTVLCDEYLGFVYALHLKLFLSSKPLPDHSEFTKTMKIILGVLYPFVFQRFPDNVSAKLDAGTCLVAWQNELSEWLVHSHLIPDATLLTLPRAHAHLISPEKKRQWALAIYSNPTPELMELIRPILISKSYKQNLEERLFLKNCVADLIKHDSYLYFLRKYLTEYSDYLVIDHPEVWLILDQHLPEDLPRSLKASDAPSLLLFKQARWFMSKNEFSSQDHATFLMTMRQIPYVDPLYEFLFHIIEYLVTTQNPDAKKLSACVELLHDRSGMIYSLCLILGKLYAANIIPKSLWPYRNADSQINSYRQLTGHQFELPLLNYFLTRSTQSKIQCVSNSEIKNKGIHQNDLGTLFLFWLEQHIYLNLKKYGIAETVIDQNYHPAHGMTNVPTLLKEHFNIGGNVGLFYDPLNAPQTSLYPNLASLTKEQLTQTLQPFNTDKKALTRIILSQTMITFSESASSKALMSYIPVAVKDQLLTRNSIENIPLRAFANFLSPSERYQFADDNLDIPENYLHILQTLLQSRSYLTSQDDRVLLLNSLNRLKVFKDVIPMLTSLNDYVLFDHCDLWLQLTRNIPLDMHLFLGENAYQAIHLNFFMYAKWWMAQNGTHSSINTHLDTLVKLIPQLDDMQKKLELLCYVVRTLLNADEKRKYIRDGCKKILNAYADLYPELHWLIAKLYEGKLLTPSNLLKDYIAFHQEKLHANYYNKLNEFFPLLNSMALRRYRDLITTENKIFKFEETGLQFLAWLEFFFLFNLNSFGISSKIVSIAYPQLDDPEWCAEFKNKFSSHIPLGRSDGLFYSLPDTNQIAHVQLEAPPATAPPESVLPTAVSSRTTSPTSSPRNSVEFEPQALQAALEKLSKSQYAEVTHVDITVSSDFSKVNDDGDLPMQPLPVLELPKEHASAPENNTELTVTALTQNQESVPLENSLVTQLKNMTPVQDELIAFPTAPTGSIEKKETRTPVALADVSFSNPGMETPRAKIQANLPESKPATVTLADKQSCTFFNEKPKPSFVTDFESHQTLRERINVVDQAFAKESANLAAIAQIKDHAQATMALSETVLANLQTLFSLKSALQAQQQLDAETPNIPANMALENKS